MIERILFVCVGNICRSPMAEALMKAKIESEAKSQFNISSAGMAALVNHPAATHAQTLMRQRNIDLSSHRARQVSAEMIKATDVIFTMEKIHQQQLIKQYPFACGRVFTLGLDVPDPYRGSLNDFEFALELIEKGINEWRNKLCTSN